MKPRDTTNLLVLAVIWGSSFLLIRLGVEQLPPMAVVELRLGLGALAAGTVALALGIGGIGRAMRRPMVALTGLCATGIPFTLLAYGETRVASGVAGISTATTPLCAALIAQAIPLRVGGERMTRRRGIGLGLGFAGVVVLGCDSVVGNLDGIGLLFCVAVPVFYAIGGMLAKYTYRDDNPVVSAVAGNALAAICLLPLAVPLGIPDRMPTIQAVGAVAALGVVGTGLAFVLFYRLMARIGTATFTVTYLMPVVAVVEGAMFLGEGIRPLAVLALLAVLAGVAISNGLVRLPGRRARAAAARAPAAAR